MNDEDFGNDRDPLLVRPFVVQDDAPVEHTSSGATWPSGAASDSATQVLPIFSAGPADGVPSGRRKRRPLLLAAAGVGVVTVLAVAGYAAFRPDFDPSLSAELPGPSLPVVTGPATASPSVEPGAAEGAGDSDDSGTGQGGTNGTTRGTATATTSARATGSASVSANPSTSTSAGASAEPNSPALAPSPLKSGTGELVSGNGLCLDLPGAIPVDDSVIQVFDCNKSVAQVWTLADDGTLRVMGKCALLVGDDTVHLTGCDQRTTAQWRVTDDGALVNAANGRCLTDPSAGGRPGTRVVVVRCAGSTNQRWSLR